MHDYGMFGRRPDNFFGRFFIYRILHRANLFPGKNRILADNAYNNCRGRRRLYNAAIIGSAIYLYDGRDVGNMLYMAQIAREAGGLAGGNYLNGADSPFDMDPRPMVYVCAAFSMSLCGKRVALRCFILCMRDRRDRGRSRVYRAAAVIFNSDF